MMDRSTWLNEIRRSTEEAYTREAPGYDDNWGQTIDPTHTGYIAKFLRLCPPGGTILAAACGTGKYWSLILESGKKVQGVDQSQGMLARAHAKFPEAKIETIGLQELRYEEAFDGVICMDAIENVFPEDWGTVLTNLHRALRPKGCFYFTVELAAETDIEQAFAGVSQIGLPVVHGEWAQAGEYHYYPETGQVKNWLASVGFAVIEEKSAPFEEAGSPLDEEAGYIGEGYYHVLAQKN